MIMCNNICWCDNYISLEKTWMSNIALIEMNNKKWENLEKDFSDVLKKTLGGKFEYWKCIWELFLGLYLLGLYYNWISLLPLLIQLWFLHILRKKVSRVLKLLIWKWSYIKVSQGRTCWLIWGTVYFRNSQSIF